MSSTEQTQGRRHDDTSEMTRVLGRLDVIAVTTIYPWIPAAACSSRQRA